MANSHLRFWMIGSFLLLGFVGSMPGAASAATQAQITIHVHDYAGVPGDTLLAAEKVTAQIFQKAGVVAGFVNHSAAQPITSEASAAEAQQSLHLSQFQLSIYPREHAGSFHLPDNAMGLAPGQGPDRQMAYVFFNRVEHVFYRQVDPSRDTIFASIPQILGHAMAHELGHLILNISAHSAFGIMRGEWTPSDLRDAGQGYLLFTPDQARILRAESARRFVTIRATANPFPDSSGPDVPPTAQLISAVP